MLVVILIYCFVKSFLNTPVAETAVAVLIFSYAIEVLQYFNIVTILGLQNSAIARVVIGTSFEWIDLIAYTLGIVVALFAEKFFRPKKFRMLQAA
jgi:glycopeptide antibiotics resistance protein